MLFISKAWRQIGLIFIYVLTCPSKQVDGVFLPSDPKDLLKRGAFDNSTEILLGNNLDEGTNDEINVAIYMLIL